MPEKEIWRWNVNLAWELFSSAVYNYRLSFKTPQEHKKHSFYKNTILNSVTAVDAFCNEILLQEFGWSKNKIEECKDILGALGIAFQKTNFKKSKTIRNQFIVHHKRIDHLYFEKINHISALEAIESAQEIISEISFLMNKLFPYWITGLNFINPSAENDITLLNNYEFWCRFKWLNCSPIVNDMVKPTGDIFFPKEKKIYTWLYKGIWEEIKKSKFKLEVLNSLKFKKFSKMPFLTSEWWEI